MTDREAMKMAFNALLLAAHTTRITTVLAMCAEATDALRQALAQPEQEKLCVVCGKPTMHMGNKCYGCCQTAQPEQDHGFDRTSSHMAGEYVDTARTDQEPVAYADPLDLAKDGNWDTFICKHSSENHKGTRFKIPLYALEEVTK